jgi:hypothetical protein
MKEKSDKLYFMFGKVGEIFIIFPKKNLPGGMDGTCDESKQVMYQFKRQLSETAILAACATQALR